MSTSSRASLIFFAVLAVALAMAIPAKAQCDVTAMGWIVTGESVLPAISLRVVANRVGDPTIIIPETANTIGILMAVFKDLAVGEYDITVQEPGFYFFKSRITVGPTDTGISTNLWLVPISSGLTAFVHYDILSFHIYPNITIPASAGFSTSFTGISLYSGSSNENYLWGTPPAAIQNWYLKTTFTGTRAGTYRFYMDVLQYPGSPALFNYTMGSAIVSVFVGTDAETGWKGTFKSEHHDAISWYVGDFVVTNPSLGCSRYHWQPVNSYSQVVASDQTDHGQGTFLAEECIDVSPAALACADPIYADDVETLVCGAFGDPHILTFDNVGVTCGYDPIITLVENEYFSITADTRFLNGTNNATAIRAVTLTYKGYCNPTTVKFDDLANIVDTPFNSPHSFRHRLYISGNNAYVDALHLRLQVRKVDESVVFGISMPRALIGQSTGICVLGCPAGTSIDETAVMRKRNPAEVQLALDACTDAGLTPGTFQYNACLFDVSSTHDVTYANAAVQSNVVRAEVAQSWASSPTTAPVQPGSASALSFSAALIVAAIMAVLL